MPARRSGDAAVHVGTLSPSTHRKIGKPPVVPDSGSNVAHDFAFFLSSFGDKIAKSYSFGDETDTTEDDNSSNGSNNTEASFFRRTRARSATPPPRSRRLHPRSLPATPTSDAVITSSTSSPPLSPSKAPPLPFPAPISSSSSISSISSGFSAILSSSTHSTTSQNSATPAASTSTGKNEYELKMAQHATIGSIEAVINFLKTSGASLASIEQLQRNLKQGRYFAVLKRAQSYIQCLCVPSKDKGYSDASSCLATSHLALHAWESLTRLKQIQFKMARKNCHVLCVEMSTSTHTDIQTATEIQVKLAEQCAATQKNLYHVRKWQQRLERFADHIASMK